MELNDLDAPLHPAPAFDLRIAHARVLPDPQKILSWEWLRHQIYTINWANVALLIAVIAVSTNINTQLDRQRAANEITSEQLATQAAQISSLNDAISSAQHVTSQLNASRTLLESYNATLSLALSLGMTNITGTLARLSAEDPPHTVGDAVSGLGTAFQNGWVQDTLHSRFVRFWQDRGVVHLEGATLYMPGGTAGTCSTSPCAILFTLPAAYAPPAARTFIWNPTAAIVVNPNGEISLEQVGSANAWSAQSIEFSGISFAVAPQTPFP